jgi:hypothetical protein
VGDWALTTEDGGAVWLGVTESGGQPNVEMMWRFGSIRQTTNAQVADGKLSFESKRNVRGEEVVEKFEASLQGDEMTLLQVSPTPTTVTGRRQAPLPPAPDLSQVQWGEPVELFNGEDLTGWRLTNPKPTNGWSVQDGVLVNSTPGRHETPRVHYGNLRTEQEFEDFKLSFETRTPEKGNSGAYLRGIYEVQVGSRSDGDPGVHGPGSVFGRIAPSSNAAKPAGEWQTYEITLVDRHITVVLNGTKVIDNQPLRGCTGGALWSDVERPGPIYLQGDHTDVEYRNIVLVPALEG